MAEQYVAVYGSLRRDCGNHGVIGRLAGHMDMGDGQTELDIDLYDYAGSFPAVAGDRSASGVDFVSKANKSLTVEVYGVTTEQLHGPVDSLEGYPSFYDRQKIQVKLDTGETVSAWIYFLAPESIASCPLVESGDWTAYKQAQKSASKRGSL